MENARAADTDLARLPQWFECLEPQATSAWPSGLQGNSTPVVEPVISLLQSLLQLAPWMVGAAALAGIAYMIGARIEDRHRGLR